MNPSGRSKAALSRRMLADDVYDSLLVSLVDGEFQPDSALTIDHLARDLEVSQTPIREALARLEATGLVRRTALKGYRVAPPASTEDLAELIEARLVIEPVNAFKTAQRIDGARIEALRASIESLSTSPTGPSFAEFREYWEADEKFHRLIAEGAHNPYLLSAYQALGGQVQRFRLFVGLGVTDANHAIAEHTTILEAFERGDAEGARDGMVAHLSGVRHRALSESIDRAI